MCSGHLDFRLICVSDTVNAEKGAERRGTGGAEENMEILTTLAVSPSNAGGRNVSPK